MSRATPRLRHFAKRLLTHEALGHKPPETTPPLALLVSERLRPHLATLMGEGGFRALYARALTLASVEVPWLRAVRVKADGSLEGVAAHCPPLDPREFFEGRVVLLAQLLGLLATFIGEGLTLRLVREIWPEVPLDNMDFGEGDENEQTR